MRLHCGLFTFAEKVGLLFVQHKSLQIKWGEAELWINSVFPAAQLTPEKRNNWLLETVTKHFPLQKRWRLWCDTLLQCPSHMIYWNSNLIPNALTIIYLDIELIQVCTPSYSLSIKHKYMHAYRHRIRQ